MRNREGLPGDQKDCTKILGNIQIARKRPRLPQNRHPFAIGQGVQSTQNRGNAGTIFFNPGNCGEIAYSRRSSRNSVSNHPRGQRSAIDPELALFRNPSQIAAQPTKTDSNQHNQTGSQLDCRTTKDCNVIGRIALKWHGLQVNCGNCTSHRGIKTSIPSNLLQSFHTDCVSILPPDTQHQPTATN